MRTDRRLSRVREVLEHRQPDLTVVLENIHDPHNVSAVLRSCDAAGVVQVQLVYTDTKAPDFTSMGEKSSASARKWVERRSYRDIPHCYDTLRSEGFTILATALADRAQSPYETDLTRKIAIVVGNEHAGVSAEAMNSADGIVRIPMFGMIESLNVSVATAVILFETVRQRIAAGHYGTPKFSPDELEARVHEWATKK